VYVIMLVQSAATESASRLLIHKQRPVTSTLNNLINTAIC